MVLPVKRKRKILVLVKPKYCQQGIAQQWNRFQKNENLFKFSKEKEKAAQRVSSIVSFDFDENKLGPTTLCPSNTVFP